MREVVYTCDGCGKQIKGGIYSLAQLPDKDFHWKCLPRPIYEQKFTFPAGTFVNGTVIDEIEIVPYRALTG